MTDHSDAIHNRERWMARPSRSFEPGLARSLRHYRKGRVLTAPKPTEVRPQSS